MLPSVLARFSEELDYVRGTTYRLWVSLLDCSLRKRAALPSSLQMWPMSVFKSGLIEYRYLPTYINLS